MSVHDIFKVQANKCLYCAMQSTFFYAAVVGAKC